MAAQVCYESCGKANFEETVWGVFADAHRTDMGGRIGNADTAETRRPYALCA